MRNFIEGASVGYAVTYLSGVMAGFPWDKLASALTALWFASLLFDKYVRPRIVAWFKARKAATQE